MANKFQKDWRNTGDNALFCLEGEIAMRLVERWGLVTVDANRRDQDTAGRDTQSRQKPGQLVAEACQVAEILVAELDSRGWIQPPPSYLEVVKYHDEETLRQKTVDRQSWETLDELRGIRRKAKQAKCEAKGTDEEQAGR